MSTAGPSTALVGGVELLERAMSYTHGGLMLVTPEMMTNRTPCQEWDLRALLVHMNESLRTLDEAITRGRLDLDPFVDADDPSRPDTDPVTDPVAALRTRACRMLGAWANAQGTDLITIEDESLTSPVVAAAGAVEVAVHGWDVAWACGLARPIPRPLAEELLDVSPLLVSDADRPSRFAAQVAVARHAGPSDRLLAFLGRRPH